MDIVETLSRLPFLQGVGTDVLVQLSKDASECWLPPGEVIFEEGSIGSEIYLILDGAVEVVKGCAPEDGKRLAQRGPGDVFGEMALIETRPRFATIRTIQPTRLLVFSGRDVNAAIAKQPLLMQRVIRMLSARLRQSDLQMIADLEASEKKYRSLFEDSQDAIFLSTPAGQISDINPAGLALFGYSRQEALALDVMDFFANQADWLRCRQIIERQGLVQDFEASLLSKSGLQRECLVTVTVRHSSRGAPQTYQGIIRDITERKRAEEALRKAHSELEIRVEERTTELKKTNDQLSGMNDLLTQEIVERKKAETALQQRNEELSLLNEMSAALSSTLAVDQVLSLLLDKVTLLLKSESCSVWLVDPLTHELVCKHAVGIQSETVLHWRLPAGLGLSGWVAEQGASLLVPDAQVDERHFKGIDQAGGSQVRSFLSVPLKTREKVIGVLNVVDSTAARFSFDEQTVLELLASSAAVAIDNAHLVEALRQSEEEYRHLATHDTLTGIRNRACFEADVEALARHGPFPVTVVMADLDGLKTTNDQLGHAAGDTLLKAAAQLLLSSFRSNDIVARVGGDEFSVLLPGTDWQAAEELLDRIRKKMVLRQSSGGGLPLSMSLGSATAGCAAELTTAIKLADQHMYQEKQQHKCKIT